MNRFRVLSREVIEGHSITVRVEVPDYKLRSLRTAMYFAGIDEAKSPEAYGWQVDPSQRIVTVRESPAYESRIQDALDLLAFGTTARYVPAGMVRLVVV